MKITRKQLRRMILLEMERQTGFDVPSARQQATYFRRKAGIDPDTRRTLRTLGDVDGSQETELAKSLGSQEASASTINQLKIRKYAQQIEPYLPGFSNLPYPIMEVVVKYVFMSTNPYIYTSVQMSDLEEQYDDEDAVEEACGKCSACMTVCPTDAIVSPRRLDARRCISYLTIEHKSAIPEEFRKPMGNRIYGCDDCQLFCPWNREAPTTTEPDFAVRNGLDSPRLVDLFALSKDEFLALTEGSAMRRVGYAQWQRNIAIALGNSPGGKEVERALKAGLGRVSAMVDEHIHWALDQLASS